MLITIISCFQQEEGGKKKVTSSLKTSIGNGLSLALDVHGMCIG
jgi:hypothetical protein